MAASLVWALVILAGVDVCHGSPESNRIVGGQVTTIENYPAIVQVEALGVFNGIWGHLCGANILTTRYVLSAAHCFDGFVLHRRIRAGSSYADVGGVVAYIRKENNHPNYGKLWFDADITVVELTSSLAYSPAVQQTTIMAQNATFPYGSAVVHAGWGAMWENGPTSPVLRDVTIYTIDTQLCKARYDMLPEYYHVTDDMICAGILDVGGRDACQGDSGGPLYFGNILVGIVSWGHGCANETFPGVSARVASYTDWIVATVG